MRLLFASLLMATSVLGQSCTYYGTPGTCRDTSVCTGAFGATLGTTVTGCQTGPVSRLEMNDQA